MLFDNAGEEFEFEGVKIGVVRGVIVVDGNELIAVVEAEQGNSSPLAIKPPTSVPPKYTASIA